MMIYLLHIYLFGRKAASSGSWPAPLKRLSVWKWMRDYFPAQMIRTADLDPSRPYLFAVHPHGILAQGAWLGFATDATSFPQLYPGVNPHFLTLTPHFRTPFLREFLLLHGVCDSAKETCVGLLARGQSIVLTVGGARESLYAKPGTVNLVLERRKGFVKVALETGASLVPVISFGENDVYDTVLTDPASVWGRIQRYFLTVWGVTLPDFKGRGIFFMPFVKMQPYAVPMNIVVGAPLHVQKFEGDIESKEGKLLVDSVHSQYKKALLDLWEVHKARFLANPETELRFI
ncbi:2-acylglycerol O-acyltransferase 2 [Klebsormidium nitens]|uniref:diacylglycerol O-acyltransferase n=1 Tax=Klebsormidium nitens TaxID=105231 RepID=A0A1Y1I637_KLENI|nr:2-acylglycerol O-acyltransferase 2 [Klebsormidium nitens]|eukprot:GAQ84187.1 2-acylglycerol O-acyltransferase 2 [Klebsormidium nitens]